MGGAEKSVPVDGAEDVEIARREDDAMHGGALEARSAGLRVSHQVSVRGAQ
jgi:hypothetical protein